MQSKATSVEAYLEELPADRREAIEKVRATVNAHLDKDFAEGMSYGMIGWFVPHSIFPAGYHCDPSKPLPFAALASQKNGMSLYLMCLYQNDALLKKFKDAWARSGKKLDMGKSCIRFKRVEDLPLDVVGEMIGSITAKNYVAQYEKAITGRKPMKREEIKKMVAEREAAKKHAAAGKRSAKTLKASKASR